MSAKERTYALYWLAHDPDGDDGRMLERALDEVDRHRATKALIAREFGHDPLAAYQSPYTAASAAEVAQGLPVSGACPAHWGGLAEGPGVLAEAAMPCTLPAGHTGLHENGGIEWGGHAEHNTAPISQAYVNTGLHAAADLASTGLTYSDAGLKLQAEIDAAVLKVPGV